MERVKELGIRLGVAGVILLWALAVGGCNMLPGAPSAPSTDWHEWQQRQTPNGIHTWGYLYSDGKERNFTSAGECWNDLADQGYDLAKPLNVTCSAQLPMPW